MHLVLIGGAALAIYFLSRGGSQDSTSNAPGSVDIPAPVAPVVTDQNCVGKTDAQGNWYGVDLSGNCTLGAYGGDTGTW